MQFTGIDITPEEFKSNSFVMAYDSCPELCAGLRTHLPKNGTIGLEIELKKALLNPISILVYQVYDKYMELDGLDNSCTVKYLS